MHCGLPAGTGGGSACGGGETIEAGEKNEKSFRITEVFTHNFCYTSALPYGILMVAGLRRTRRPRWAERRTNWMGLIF